MSTNIYSAPAANLDASKAGPGATVLWNPGAAAAWSLLFTPIFGALLHMGNWEALGKHDEARKSLWWAIATGAFSVGSVVLAFVMPEGWLGALENWLWLIWLLLWYALHARDQVDFVNYAVEGDYIRRGWGKPFLITAVVYVLLVGLVFAFLTIFGASIIAGAR